MIAWVTASGCAEVHGETTLRLVDVSNVAFDETIAQGEADLLNIGAPVAVGDYNGDSQDDIFVAGSDASGAKYWLLENDGSGRFTDCYAESGLKMNGSAPNAAAFLDLDNDGDQDLVTAGKKFVHVFRNDEDGFAPAPVFERTSSTTTTSIAAADFDNDGLLDLYLTNFFHDTSSPDADARANTLLRNLGHLMFENVGEDAGVADRGASWTALWFDYDSDGWADIYVANDTGATPSQPALPFLKGDSLYRNLGNGSFKDVSTDVGIATKRASMGIAVGDWNRDGSQDLFISDFGPNDVLLSDEEENWTETEIEDEAEQRAAPQISWGVASIDLDRDGWEDLMVVNGSVLGFGGLSQAQTDAVLMNTPVAGLEPRGNIGLDGDGAVHQGRGLATIDMESDGDTDFLVAPYHDDLRIYRNDSQTPGHGSLVVRLVGNGTTSNRDAIGSRVEVTTSGGRKITRYLHTSGSPGTTSAKRLEFGLGSDRVEVVRVRWPDRSTSTVHNPETGSDVLIEQRD